MSRRRFKSEDDRQVILEERASAWSSPKPVADVPGPGRWLVVEYQPISLFSLKISLATSSVGKTLLVPTPYAIKMAFVDAAFRAGLSREECEDFFGSLAPLDVRTAPPETAIVTHTFVKVRQEPKKRVFAVPYTSSIAYREFAHYQGACRWAFDLAAGDHTLAERLVHIAPHVNYIGKRGSFIQFQRIFRVVDLGTEFTQPVHKEALSLPPRAHIVPLDDFGPKADLETLSSFSKRAARRNVHRRFVDTIVPLGIVNTGSNFTEYRAI